MDIAKKLYLELTAKQRAIATYAAMNRGDQAEVDRLIGRAPRRSGHGLAILGLGQAMDAYNHIVSKATRDFLLATGKAMAAASFCEGWVSAGGATDNEQYQKNCQAAEALSLMSENRAGEIEAARQAAWEWCENNDVPVDFFSGPLCFIPLQKNNGDGVKSPINSEFLTIMRSVFNGIKLT